MTEQVISMKGSKKKERRKKKVSKAGFFVWRGELEGEGRGAIKGERVGTKREEKKEKGK
jgi:hypothetical protein